MAGRSVYRFDGFTLDPARGALFGPHGAEVAMRPKSFALLRHLVENAGRLIGRDELLAAVWPGVFVTEDSITLCVKEIRRTLEDEERRRLRTMPRRGYLFAAEVSRSDAAAPPLAAPETAAPPSVIPEPAEPASRGAAAQAHPVAGRPTLVVLPFANMSADPAQDYFADGITEDLTNALSHLRWFCVISSGSAFTYKGRAVDVRRVGRELGAGYALEGSVRRAGGRVRVTTQLCETQTGRHVWAGRFDGDLADIFGIQDRVTEAVVGAIEPSLRLAEMERTRSRPTESLGAYDLYLRALPHRYTSRAANEEALVLLRRAVALDPGFTAAKGALAGLHTVRFTQGWAAPEDLVEGVHRAREVVEQGGEDDPSALALAAHALAYLGHEYDAGLAAADRALRLGPGSAMILLVCGTIRAYTGDADTAVALIERAARLSPVDPGMFYAHSALAIAHFAAERYEAAAAAARRALRDRPGYVSACRLLAASLGRLGRAEEAAEAVRALLAAAPGYTLAAASRHVAMQDPASRARYLDGLRTAGLPD